VPPAPADCNAQYDNQQGSLAFPFGNGRGNRVKIENDATTAPEHIMQFFAWEHLPAHLQGVSLPFQSLARMIVNDLPSNPERTVALRKLLEAKDASVRAKIAK
jgi:hypothetical protein